MSKNPYAARQRRPHRSTVAGLTFKTCYRCVTCGTVYDKEACQLAFKSKKPTQCSCGSITFEFFHSKGEARRYATLLLLESKGKISNLQKQVRFPLYTIDPNGLKIKVCDYIADFEYDDIDGRRVVEEFKGGMTAVAELKLKWFERQMGFKPKITQG